MKAVVYYGPGKLSLEDRPKPAARSNNLIVEVACCAICGTDVKLGTIGHHRCHPPRIIGHEMAGKIVHVGKNVSNFAVGQRITLATTVACGTCFYCKIGKGNICPNSEPISFDVDGAFAEYVEIPPKAISGGNVVKVPPVVSNEAAALSEPLSCVVNAQDLAGVQEGDTVCIIGGGPLGALHAEAAKAVGAKRVMIVGNSEPRLSFLRRLENVEVIDGSTTDVPACILERTEGIGVDVVIVSAPVKERHELAFHLVRKGGTISFFASLPKDSSEIALDSRALHYGELKLVGASDSRPEHVQRAVQYLQKKMIDTETIVTHAMPIEDIFEGLELMIHRQCLKVLIYPKNCPDGSPKTVSP